MSTPAQPEEQIFSSDQEDQQCIELRQKLTLPPHQMLQLINHKQQFHQHILLHTNHAKLKIDINQKQELKFALVHLKEAQKILEYAANSGKNIDKEFIITVLHNQASIYQKLWELSDCSDYLQGIIFNYQNFIKQISCQGSTLVKDLPGLPPDPTKIKMKQKLARYNLQFCAVSSQLGTHDAAIQAVSRAQRLMNQCVTGCFQEYKKLCVEQGKKISQINQLLDLLAGLANYQKKIELTQPAQLSKNILKATHYSIQIWQEQKQKPLDNISATNKQYLQYLSTYSIGNIVEIVAIKLDKQEIGFLSMRQKGDVQFDRQYHPYNRIILLSTCFFSRATQLRLKSAQIYKKNPQQRKYSRQFRLSINYHLIAIIIAAAFIPANLKYISQILLSYEKHYSVKLTQYQSTEITSLTKMMQVLQIQFSQLMVSTEHNTSKGELELDSKNDYNMKVAFNDRRSKKSDKMKYLKKITKQLTDPYKKYQAKQIKTPKNKSKESKTSFSLSKHEKKDRSVSKNSKKHPEHRFHDTKDKAHDRHKHIPKVKCKKSNDLMNSRQREEKKSKSKQYVDQTQQLFFCFSKKTKKTQGVVGTSHSQLRSSSIASNSNRSKNSKKSLLSPKNMKINKVSSPVHLKPTKSPPKRKNIGEQHYYF